MSLCSCGKSITQSQGPRLQCPKCRKAAKDKRYRLKHAEQKKARDKAYRAANREKLNAYFRKWRSEHLEQGRALTKASRKRYKARHPDRVREQNSRVVKAWKKKNPARAAALHTKAQAARRARMAAVAWSDNQAIRAIYDEAQRISRETGIKHHVDHIIPLKGKTVCGLHVSWNLRVIPGVENIRKGARLIESLAA
jgi:flagellum-specific peptidoglycan hydrolase FlgJ